MERVTGIEPALIAWKAIVLPLNYTRNNMVLKEGLEPSRYCYHRILSPVRLPFRHFSNMVSHRRLELRTPSLKVKCSTTELVGHIWLGRVDSNHRMSESKSDALPLGYNPTMVDRSGFEPLKPWVADLQSAAFGRFAICPYRT